MDRRIFMKNAAVSLSLLSFTGCISSHTSAQPKKSKPNIIYILADDLGFGDIQCQNHDSKYPTPNLDLLAEQGGRFTDVHTNSAVCTPTRYGILTGRYSWRTALKGGVLGSYDPALIGPERKTVATLLQDNGYRTGCIGKWHLGVGWIGKDGKPLYDGRGKFDKGYDAWKNGYKVDFTKPVCEGPKDIGFEYSYICPSSADLSPFVFLENNHCTAVPGVTVKSNVFGRPGFAIKGLGPEDFLGTFTHKSVEFISKSSKDSRPFFLYLPLTAPHKPVAPSKRFKGKTDSLYGDFVCEVDWVVGQIVKALKDNSVAGKTLVVFTADNGASPGAAKSSIIKGHKPNKPYRGGKTLLWDGGHRVPFFMKWPGKIKESSVCDDLYCTTDFAATCADIVGKKLPVDLGEDSVSMLDSMLGNCNGDKKREAIVHHSGSGDFAIRKGKWKLITIKNGGGWANTRDFGMPILPIDENITGQLYNIEEDVYEQQNLYSKHPEIVSELTRLLVKYVSEGRSTPGPKQKNDGPQHWEQLNNFWPKDNGKIFSFSSDSKVLD